MLTISKAILALLLVLAAGAGATASVVFRSTVVPVAPGVALVPTCTPPAAAIEADRKFWQSGKVQNSAGKEY
jgi:hypothetical protein